MWHLGFGLWAFGSGFKVRGDLGLGVWNLRD